MPRCPKCSAKLDDARDKCPSCGAEVNVTSDPTAMQDADHTPTRLKKTRAEERVHTTASGSGARFVAGHVLAGRYRIIGLIGRGGMGEVYKAEDLELDQTVALKFLPAELSKEEQLLKRFRSEVRTARQVSHPNVCRVFDIGETEGLYYITMEYIEGDDLSMLLQRIGRLPSDKAVEISRQICLGLGAIHKAGILHRDLKPSNIIIDQKGEARITDFGIAGIEAEVQGEESRVGTPAYMSPEQITGKEVTKRSDIYSLGLLLYEIFTGKQAFEGSSVQELREKHTKETPTNPSELVTGIDPVVEDLIERCLKKDPVERPDSALKVAMMLPGGNPLQVALEAGETPTPEMVAAAPEKGVLRPLYALLLLAGFVSLFLLTMYCVSVYSDAGLSPIYKSADVLESDSRSILEEVGYETRIGYTASSFAAEELYDFYITETGSQDSLEKMRTGQPFGPYFWFKQSSTPLFGSEGPFITEDSPPKNAKGSKFVKVDVKGRLVELLVTPDLVSSATVADREPDWSKLFDLAGLNLSDYREVVPDGPPPVFADRRGAWEGSLVDHPDIPVRIEAASYQGRPVYFEVIPPWDKGDQETDLFGTFVFVQLTVFLVFMLLTLICGVLLAYRNIKIGRVDKKGAAKLGAFILLATALGGLLRATHSSSVETERSVLFYTLSNSLVAASLIVILYMAIEPLVRRWWPQLLISWNRLLAREFRSPSIGRDFLIGGLLGSLQVFAFIAGGLLRDQLYSKSLTKQTTIAIGGLSEPLNYIGILLWITVSYPIFNAFAILTLLLVFYLIFRNKLVAAVVLAILLSALFNLPWVFNRGLEAASVTFVFWAMAGVFYARFGVVVIAVSAAVGSLALVPVTFDPARPYFVQSILTVAVVLAIGVYSFYIALGKQKMFGQRSFADLDG